MGFKSTIDITRTQAIKLEAQLSKNIKKPNPFASGDLTQSTNPFFRTR